MATASKTYVVEDADNSAGSGSPSGVFPGTLKGLLEALDAARFRSAAGTPKVLVVAEGNNRRVIRRPRSFLPPSWSSATSISRRSRTMPSSARRSGTLLPGIRRKFRWPIWIFPQPRKLMMIAA